VTPFAKFYTDESILYEGLEKKFIHKVVNHTQEYVKGQVHTQGMDNYWSLLKRTLRGTYIAVEPFHLSRYLDEQAFRYNNRATKDNPLDDGDRFAFLVTQILGRRLTYKELTGKAATEGDPREAARIVALCRISLASVAATRIAACTVVCFGSHIPALPIQSLIQSRGPRMLGKHCCCVPNASKFAVTRRRIFYGVGEQTRITKVTCFMQLGFA